MKEGIIWDLRADAVKQLVQEGKRQDGRKFGDYRDISFETGISDNANGSCKVTLGETVVLAGTKFGLSEPYPDSPNKGSITVGVELMPMASPTFEPGPPRANAIELARVVDRGIRESKAIDFEALCITEGEQVWFAFIDTYVANDAGNLFDACSLAALGSLLEAKFSKLEDGKIVKGEYGSKLKMNNKPILCTASKIGNEILADTTITEEKARDARLSIATISDTEMSAFQKGEPGFFTRNEIEQCIDLAFVNGKKLRSKFK